MQNSIYTAVYNLYPELKFWGFALGIVWALFKYTTKVTDWAKDVKDNHLTHIEESMAQTAERLDEQNEHINKQTVVIVEELKGLRTELRDDLRSLTTVVASKL